METSVARTVFGKVILGGTLSLTSSNYGSFHHASLSLPTNLFSALNPPFKPARFLLSKTIFFPDFPLSFQAIAAKSTLTSAFRILASTMERVWTMWPGTFASVQLGSEVIL